MAQVDVKKENSAFYSFNYLLESVYSNKNLTDNLIWLGIGSGTTVKYFIELLGKQYSDGLIPFKFVTISSSIDSERLCRSLNLPIRQLDDLTDGQKIDYYIDGADEVDKNKRCLKGLGGALTREKLLRIESNKFFTLVDESKLVPSLCTKTPIVIEILQFGFGKTLERLKKLFPSASKIEMRKGSGKMGFVITDNNNYLVDVYFDKALSQDYDFKNLEKEIRLISGVIESGLFADPADVVFIASLSKVEIIS